MFSPPLKKYSGVHKQRFDADGKGKGLAGRADLVDFSGIY